MCCHDWRVLCVGELDFCLNRLARLLELCPDIRYRMDECCDGEWVVEVSGDFNLDQAILDALAPS